MKLDSYTLTSILRKTRRLYPLTATEQALFYELVAICNEAGWVEWFPCSSQELCFALNISKNTLDRSRHTLISTGLISYKSGKSKRMFSSYSLQTMSKSDIVKGMDKGIVKGFNVGMVAGLDVDKKVGTYIKEKLKTKTKQSKSHSSANANAKKNSKKEMLFWKEFIEVWNQFYLYKLENPYFYLQKDFAHFKKIHQFLKKRIESKKRDFSKENLTDTFLWFLEKAWEKDEWLRQNFTVSNVLSQFNQIVNESKQNGRKSNYNNGTSSNKLSGRATLNLNEDIAEFT